MVVRKLIFPRIRNDFYFKLEKDFEKMKARDCTGISDQITFCGTLARYTVQYLKLHHCRVLPTKLCHISLSLFHFPFGQIHEILDQFKIKRSSNWYFQIKHFNQWWANERNEIISNITLIKYKSRNSE
jgi:hypothetical protein